MSVRTNTANGGTSYVDMDIQTVSDDASQTTFRAVIYLTSRNVTDTTNVCSVTGQWSRGGALGLGGTYNSAAVWSQDVSFGKYVGQAQTVGWNLAWSSVDYWGTTLSGTAYATVPGTYGVPSTPYGYYARSITTSSAYTGGVNADNVAGGVWNNLWVQWGLTADMNNLTGSRQMGAFTDGLMDGLAPGRVYYFRVAIANSYYWSAWGAVTSFTSASAVPAATSVVVDTVTATSAHSWVSTIPAQNGSSADLCGYHLYRVSDNADLGEQTGSYATGITWSTLTRATTYDMYARSHNAIGWGPYGPAVRFTTLSTVPSTMAAPTVSGITLSAATVSYVAPTDTGGSAITGYSVQYATNAGFTTGLVTQSTGALTGLTPSTNYWTRVAAINAIGTGAYSPSTAFTSGATVPSAPAAPTISQIVDDGARATWTAPAANGAAITGYRVQWTDGTTTIFADVAASPYDITGLTPKVAYTVTVRATNSVGNGAYSSGTAFTTLSALFLRVLGTFQRCELWMNDKGTWKVITLYLNVGGSNKKIS